MSSGKEGESGNYIIVIALAVLNAKNMLILCFKGMNTGRGDPVSQ